MSKKATTTTKTKQKAKSTKVKEEKVETTVETKASLKKELEDVVARWNESAEFSEFSVMSALQEKIDEAAKKYTAACEGECFIELKKAKNPMLEAAKVLCFETLAVKDEKVKDVNGKPTPQVKKVLKTVTKRIDPLRLHKTTKDGIGADKLWMHYIERLNMLFTAATAIEINAVDKSGTKLDLQKIKDTIAMKDEAKKLLFKGEDAPSDDEILLKDVQTVIEAMIGKGYAATPAMVKYLRKVHERGGRDSMTVVCSNARSMRHYMLDVCHAAVVGDDFILDYKKAKA